MLHGSHKQVATTLAIVGVLFIGVVLVWTKKPESGRIETSIIKKNMNIDEHHGKISFGDNVRIRRSPETEKLSLAGMVGAVFGETTPSVTNVPLIGTTDTDHAYNVFFEERKVGFWFTPELIEFVDHGAGTKIRIGGVEATRTESGEWLEKKIPNKSWWRFW